MNLYRYYQKPETCIFFVKIFTIEKANTEKLLQCSAIVLYIQHLLHSTFNQVFLFLFDFVYRHLLL